jgi:hypothetical protein
LQTTVNLHCNLNKLKKMSVVYMLLGRPNAFGNKCDAICKGILTPDNYHVFSILDFLQIVLSSCPEPQKSRKAVQKLWRDVCRCNAQFMEVQGTLGLAVPTPKMRKTDPKAGATAGMTVPGLRALLDVIGNHQVSAACRRVVEDIFARYMLGDKSMLVQINLNDKVHRIPSFSYNFQPPTAREPEAGASSVSTSRESSITST